MFNVDISDSGNDDSEKATVLKNKSDKLNGGKQIHSSLCHSSVVAPPLLEYKTIEGYCEVQRGKSMLPDRDRLDIPSTSGINNIQSITSPIVFKSPKLPVIKRTLPFDGPKPYALFSVEELSLVKCLKHWMNIKVCAVGKARYDCQIQQCYLDSVMETGRWQLLLDTSLLQQIPVIEKVIQVFGTLEIVDSMSKVKVNFYRNIESGDLKLFIDSYKLMQKYVPECVDLSEKMEVDPEFVNTHIKGNIDSPSSDKNDRKRAKVELNDTLDEFNFSEIL